MQPNKLIKAYILAGSKAKLIKKRICDYIDNQEILCINALYEHILFLINLYGVACKFPPNINGPGIVAHDTAGKNELRVIKKGVVKIDIGIVYRNCIVDTAFSYSFKTKEYDHIYAVNQDLFNKVLPLLLKPGLAIYKISETIEKHFLNAKLFIFSELSGHTIKPPILHAAPLIPSDTSCFIEDVLQPGQIFTIEPHSSSYPSTLCSKKAKIYQHGNSYYNTKDPISYSILKNEIILHPVLTLENAEKNESFIFEHTYLVTKTKVIQIS